MRILFDTNVILDVLLKRQPHEKNARWLVRHVEKGGVEGLLAATTLTTIDYVAGRAEGHSKAQRDIRILLTLFETAAVDHAVLVAAWSHPIADFEDAVIHEAARHANADGIVTRNLDDFDTATLPVYSPPALVRVLRNLPCDLTARHFEPRIVVRGRLERSGDEKAPCGSPSGNLFQTSRIARMKEILRPSGPQNDTALCNSAYLTRWVT